MIKKHLKIFLMGLCVIVLYCLFFSGFVWALDNHFKITVIIVSSALLVFLCFVFGNMVKDHRKYKKLLNDMEEFKKRMEQYRRIND